MPYIESWLRSNLAAIEQVNPGSPGELNYCFTVLAHRYVESKGGGNYQAFNDVIGALEAAKLELYRRRIAPYEDLKIRQNGDLT